eukprot:m.4886 g.4886  ORF g.4886 m.4886 type:complete len:128 (-) comp3795_c0_seq1:310-693(-)
MYSLDTNAVWIAIIVGGFVAFGFSVAFGRFTSLSARHSSDNASLSREESHDLSTGSIKNSIILTSRDDGTDILEKALDDGSSVVCKLCGDIIKRERWDAHRDMWCSKLQVTDLIDPADNYGDDMDVD